MFCHDFRLRHRKSRQNGSDIFLYHRLNPWNGKAIIPQVKPVEWQIHYSTGLKPVAINITFLRSFFNHSLVCLKPIMDVSFNLNKFLYWDEIFNLFFKFFKNEGRPVISSFSISNRKFLLAIIKSSP